MVKNKLSGITLCFVFFKILVCVIPFAFDVQHIATQTVFNGGVYTEVHFCFIIEVNKLFRNQYISFKLWNDEEPDFNRIVRFVTILRSKNSPSDFHKPLY